MSFFNAFSRRETQLRLGFELGSPTPFPTTITITLNVGGAYDKFPDFSLISIQNCRRFLKIHYVIAIHLMRWLTNFYDFRFKWTATAAIGIHPTKAWLSQLLNFRNAIWTLEERYAIKFCFKLGKNDATETYGMLQTAFSTILHELSMSFWVT